MRYGIFADVHSNLEALNVIVDSYKNEHIDRYLCLGDIVGYAANPAECIQIVKGLSSIIIAGNHDWAVVDRSPSQHFNAIAREAIIWTSSHLSSDDKKFLFGLPLLHTEENFTLVHGTLHRPHDFHYLDRSIAAYRTLSVLDKQLCFVGHTHIPGVFEEEPKDMSFRQFSTLQLKDNKKYIINVGSVGQPRDGNPNASLVIYDTQSKTVELRRVAYDFSITQEKILKARLPSLLASRLSQGI